MQCVCGPSSTKPPYRSSATGPTSIATECNFTLASSFASAPLRRGSFLEQRTAWRARSPSLAATTRGASGPSVAVAGSMPSRSSHIKPLGHCPVFGIATGAFSDVGAQAARLAVTGRALTTLGTGNGGADAPRRLGGRRVRSRMASRVASRLDGPATIESRRSAQGRLAAFWRLSGPKAACCVPQARAR